MWCAYFTAVSFGYRLRAMARHRPEVLTKFAMSIHPACRHFIESLRKQRRLLTLKLLEKQPCSLPFDVGYDIVTQNFLFRGADGRVGPDHPVLGNNGKTILAFTPEGLPTKVLVRLLNRNQ